MQWFVEYGEDNQV